MTKRVKIGEVGVDSGTLILIDPCYIKYIKDIHGSDEGWQNFCKEVLGKMVNEATTCADGIVFSNQIGDGSFPVYATYGDDNRIKKLEVVFTWT